MLSKQKPPGRMNSAKNTLFVGPVALFLDAMKLEQRDTRCVRRGRMSIASETKKHTMNERENRKR
jgi:hypothetical protein